jgi:hypothetical protein
LIGLPCFYSGLSVVIFACETLAGGFYLTNPVMKLHFLPYFLFLNACLPVFAQKAPDDVLYLRNGWVLRGKLLTAEENSVRMETHDKNIFVFPLAEVSRTTQEPPIRRSEVRYKSRGFAHFTEFGALGAANRASNAITTSAFSLQTVNGYKFNTYFFAGVGVGIDLFAIQNIAPVFLSLRGDFTDKGSVIPYYFLDGGYGFNATINDSDSVRYTGGETFGGGIGLKLLYQGNAAFTFSTGYRYQQAAPNFPQRLTIRIGFSF